MNAREAIKNAVQGADMICKMYLEDLTDAELLVRPVPGANHIAWQLGHLIVSENNLVDSAFPGSMPALPKGFAEKHNNETAASDDAAAFSSKAEYLKLQSEQRAGTLAALTRVCDADLDKPGPEKYRNFMPKMADVFTIQGNHWLMHAGQWAVVRRKLGRKPLF